MSESNQQIETKNERSLLRLPNELIDMVLENIPRTVIVREWRVSISQHGRLDQSGSEIYSHHLEISPPYVQPLSLNISKQSREDTLRHYERILGHIDLYGVTTRPQEGCLPPYNVREKESWVYFNFELDTLTCYPNKMLHHSRKGESYLIACPVGNYDSYPNAVIWAFTILKNLRTYGPQGTFNKFQSIALANVAWWRINNPDNPFDPACGMNDNSNARSRMDSRISNC
jgi:hypothetical protein